MCPLLQFIHTLFFLFEPSHAKIVSEQGLLAAFQEKSSKKTSMVIEFERKMKARAQSEERVLVLEKLRDEREAAREKRRLQGVLDALKRKS